MRVDVDEHFFDGDLFRLVGVYHLENAVQYGLEATGQVFDFCALAGGGLDGATGDVVEFFARFFDDPKPCEPQAGVYAKDAYGTDDLLFDCGGCINILHIVQIIQGIQQLLHLDCVITGEHGFSIGLHGDLCHFCL